MVVSSQRNQSSTPSLTTDITQKAKHNSGWWERVGMRSSESLKRRSWLVFSDSFNFLIPAIDWILNVALIVWRYQSVVLLQVSTFCFVSQWIVYDYNSPLFSTKWEQIEGYPSAINVMECRINFGMCLESFTIFLQQSRPAISSSCNLSVVENPP